MSSILISKIFTVALTVVNTGAIKAYRDGLAICNGGIGHMGHTSLALTHRSLLIVVVIKGGRRSP